MAMKCVVCGTKIEAGKLMCAPHWAMLPLKAQLDVFNEWAKPTGKGDFWGMVKRAARFVRREMAEAPQKTS